VTITERTTLNGRGASPAVPVDELTLLDEYWRAANYLSVGQIYLMDNPFLTERATRRACETTAVGALGAPRQVLTSSWSWTSSTTCPR
jgi:xylulose-5-phosphate/fructose-6-phosphate phosphoketolase